MTTRLERQVAAEHPVLADPDVTVDGGTLLVAADAGWGRKAGAALRRGGSRWDRDGRVWHVGPRVDLDRLAEGLAEDRREAWIREHGALVVIPWVLDWDTAEDVHEAFQRMLAALPDSVDLGASGNVSVHRCDPANADQARQVVTDYLCATATPDRLERLAVQTGQWAQQERWSADHDGGRDEAAEAGARLGRCPTSSDTTAVWRRWSRTWTAWRLLSSTYGLPLDLAGDREDDTDQLVGAA